MMLVEITNISKINRIRLDLGGLRHRQRAGSARISQKGTALAQYRGLTSGQIKVRMFQFLTFV